MAATLMKEFLVGIGFKVDSSSQTRAMTGVAKTEAKITAVVQSESAKRLKVSDKESDKRLRRDDDLFKKARERRAVEMKEFEKNAERMTVLAQRLGETVSGVVSGFAASAAFKALVGTADAYSQLQLQSRRTGAAPRNIAALVYGLGQMGVDKGEASGSFEGFSRALQSNPGLRAMLKSKGLDADGDPAELFSKLGTYFKTLPYSAQLAAAGNMGIGQNALNAIDRQDELSKQMGGFDKITNAFGLDPDKAASDGRDFTAAYSKLAADLVTIQDKLESTFFKPMATAMTGLSEAMEKNPKTTEALIAGFEGLSAIVSLSLLARLAKMASILSGMTAPAWLLSLLGVTGVVTTGALAESTPGEGVSADPAIRAGQAAENKRLTDEANQRTGQGKGLWTDTKTWVKKKLGLAPAQGAGRVAFGRHIGTSRANPEVRDYLRAAAAARGIEPDAAENLFAHEGLNVFDPNRPDRGGDGGSSFGPAQLHYGGINPAMPHAGMGDDFTNATGLDARDPSTWKAQIDFALDRARKKGWGAWMGRGPAHMGIWDGIGTYKPPVHPAVAAAHAALRATSESYQNPDGSSTMTNFDPKTGMVTAPSAFGALNRDAFKVAPTGVSPSLYNAYHQSRGDASFHQNVTINAHGTASPSDIAGAVKLSANRGGKDFLRNMEGSSQ